MIASHVDCASWLYPTDTAATVEANGPSQNGSGNRDQEIGTSVPKEEQSKYQPFLAVEKQLRRNLQDLIDTTTPSALEADNSTQLAAALSSALAYINKRALLLSPNADADPTSQAPGMMQADGTTAGGSTPDLVSRILIVSVSGDLSAQYISVMNAIFAAQRRHVPIDVLKLAGDAGFLQQACDATDGVYIEPERAALRGAGLLQFLMMAYLPDTTARRALLMPGQGEVDFRAACFCHRRIVDLGFVCSVCLSSKALLSSPRSPFVPWADAVMQVFCEPPPDSVCLTCGTMLDMPANFNVKPAVIPRRKKRRRRPGEASGVATPAGPSTPGP